MSIITLSKVTLRIMRLSITTLRMMKLSMMKHKKQLKMKNDCDLQLGQYVIWPSVIRLNVVVP